MICRQSAMSFTVAAARANALRWERLATKSHIYLYILESTLYTKMPRYSPFWLGWLCDLPAVVMRWIIINIIITIEDSARMHATLPSMYLFSERWDRVEWTTTPPQNNEEWPDFHIKRSFWGFFFCVMRISQSAHNIWVVRQTKSVILGGFVYGLV